jgi:hypothetical protein
MGGVFDFLNNCSFMFLTKIQNQKTTNSVYLKEKNPNQRTTGPGISKTSKSCQVSLKN